MNVVIIGSGLIGVTTAYFLQRRGHQVTVIDRRPAAGEETSYANGCLLTPSMSQPWNTPGCWRVLLASLVRSDAPLQLRLSALPSLASWGLRFLGNSRPAAYRRSTLNNLALALYSRAVMNELRRDLQLDFEHAARGALRIFRSSAALQQAADIAADELMNRVRVRQLSVEETIQLEPALAAIAPQLSGAIHYESDETGDAHRFCQTLAAHAAQLGVQFRFDTHVTSLAMQSGRVAAVLCGSERFTADRYVVAAGSYSTPLLRNIGVQLPVRPAKGYSVTFERSANAPLSVPVLDDAFHAAIVPLHGRIRVAGTAEFAGFDLTLRQSRIHNLIQLLTQVLPQGGFDAAAASPWCGLRAMSADGTPIIGTTPVDNLLISTGHGHLGWTMAAGSAELLADLMENKSTAIDSTPFSLARF